MAVPVKLVALVCAIVGTTCGSAAGPAGAGALAVVALAFLAAQGRWRLAAGVAAVVAVLGVLLALIRFAGLRMAVFSEFHVLMFWNLSPVFLTGWALVSTPPGELSSFLSRVGAPTAVILGVLVAFRFFPTMRAAVSATAASSLSMAMKSTPVCCFTASAMVSRGQPGVRSISSTCQVR